MIGSLFADFILFGLFSMYLAGEKALTSSKKKAVKEEGEK